ARVDPQHVPRTGLDQVAESAPLTNRVQRDAAMGAELAPGGVDDGARAHREPRREVAAGLAPRHEADLLALRLVRDRQRELARVLAHLAFGHTAERKHD